ncbi:MAG: 2-succinyl-6-hydroxy-2,4-cyclohexadiene-1-carboxylate synthase [Proteobacteria bacterium]|nr:2-succinyl-6-hydroxy-2,4-cyclohexadiene-1-carboxylate synthase [Pseudomonadota bacterium]
MKVELRDGLALNAECRGDGPDLLLLHGFTGARLAWEPVRAELTRDFRVIAVDLLGHGDSDRCADPARYALEKQVDDLVRVLDACGSRTPAWVGYSMGGRLSLAAAVLRPERVGALVAEGATPGLEEPEARRERVRADEDWASRIESEGLEAFVSAWMDQPLFESQHRLGPAVLAEERRRRLGNDAACLAACLRGAGTGVQPSFWGRLADVRAPCLLLAGEWDVKFTGLARRMARQIPDARVRGVPRSGHATHLENPPGWTAEVRSFVRRTLNEE